MTSSKTLFHFPTPEPEANMALSWLQKLVTSTCVHVATLAEVHVTFVTHPGDTVTSVASAPTHPSTPGWQ